jgi:glycerophosphoryl diester phosphodiesterase
VLVGLCALYAFLVAPGRLPIGEGGLLSGRFAHRGLHDLGRGVPENSLAAFRAALEAGLGMELDLQLLADGGIAVFHDDTLERACGIEERIVNRDASSLKALRLFGTAEGIPLFDDVLKLVAGKSPLIVEIKSCSRWKVLCERTSAMLNAYEGPYCIESFDPRIVTWFRKHRPGVIRGQLAMKARAYEGLPQFMRLALGSLCLNVLARPHFLAYRFEDAGRALGPRLYKLLGGRLVAWTLKSPEAEARARRLGYEGIIFEGY